MFDILKKYFTINLNDYDSINFDLEINKVVLLAFAAMIVGVVLLNLYRGSMRLLVMQLTRHGAVSEDSAKTLKEIGLADARMVKRLLERSNMLTKMVAEAGKVEYDYETYMKLTKAEREAAERVDFSGARFYIKEEEAHRAAFIIERYNTSVMRTVMSCVFVAIICGCVIVCMPGILSMIDTIIGGLGK